MYSIIRTKFHTTDALLMMKSPRLLQVCTCTCFVNCLGMRLLISSWRGTCSLVPRLSPSFSLLVVRKAVSHSVACYMYAYVKNSVSLQYEKWSVMISGVSWELSLLAVWPSLTSLFILRAAKVRLPYTLLFCER